MTRQRVRVNGAKAEVKFTPRQTHSQPSDCVRPSLGRNLDARQDSRQVQVGEDVILPCQHANLDYTIASVDWSRRRGYSSTREQLVHWTSGHYDATDGFNLTAEFGLKIKKFSLTDASIYQCNISYETSDPLSISHVFVMSAFVQNETIKGHVGRSVTFSCPSSNELRHHHHVYWKKYSHGLLQGVPPATFPHGDTAPGYTINSDFSLTIEKVLPDDEGIYECFRPGTPETAGALHKVSFHVSALPATPPQIDGCGNDGEPCKQTIPVGTKAYFTCRMEHIYPERYPTWGEPDECSGKSINSDGTLNTWCVAFVKVTDTPVERVCSFLVDSYNKSSQLTAHGWRVRDDNSVKESL
ncbi:uncharacterized protein [Diadema setosum]|uniref:uncharacterized protein n=1 Tax=Diadema setosum TaxID=31175 RepID=UPI003B3B4315